MAQDSQRYLASVPSSLSLTWSFQIGRSRVERPS
jgi:hypothetical protein